MQNISQIVDKVRSGQRINSAEAAILWREAPLWLLGELAVERGVLQPKCTHRAYEYMPLQLRVLLVPPSRER